jgi:hypothetical protein
MVTIFSASVNPSYDYDLIKIAKMSYDEAVEFFKNDNIGACSCHEYVVNTTKPNEFGFCADGADYGDGSDTMLVWVKVVV